MLVEEFCYSCKILGNDVEESHKHWHEVVAHDSIDPVVKACALSFSVISTPETTAYLENIGMIYGDRWFVTVLTIK